MSRGDADDVKKVLAAMLAGPKFLEKLQAVVTEKEDGLYPNLPVNVYDHEQLTKLAFPLAEIIVYRSNYSGEHVKGIVHQIGIRWTVVGDEEGFVTKSIERLVRATTDLLWNTTGDWESGMGQVIVSSEDYSPLAPAMHVPFIKSGLVVTQIPAWRD